ncbi:MAG: cryptochrome/photolyase family protein [Actinobacteria bacterium]|nr:cryptochrome/photolyase family protein [Actinomycetota bacterium]
MTSSRAILVFGDQLNRAIGALSSARSGIDRVLFIESTEKLAAREWHPQRLHFYVSSMRHFAEELRHEGFTVDYERSSSFRTAITEYRRAHPGTEIIATEPNSFGARELLADLGVATVASNQFLLHHVGFADWVDARRAKGYKTFKLEDFYRHQRTMLGVLMDGDEPAGGRWNFDDENREPPPRDGHDRWSSPLIDDLDDLDRQVIDDTAVHAGRGSLPVGWWATSREGALKRLAHFIDSLLPQFGPHEDAMLADNWHLAHSLLSPYLNNGLLMADEVVRAAERAYREGRADIASVEGFIRQIIGWREYVWGLYWMWMPAYRDENALGADLDLPPAFATGETSMNCVGKVVEGINERSWAHHIQRLMILGNLALTAGVEPRQFTDWMSRVFIDAAEWVMVPNVVGMALFADGGRMATKPYASGGAYIDKMSDYCKGCRYDRKKRTGDDACPFTTLYWDFLDRHAATFGRNPRIATQVRSAQKLADIAEVRVRAREVKGLLREGRL